VNTLNKLTPGENISATARVLNKPESQTVRDKKLIKLKVGDSANIANLVAWAPMHKKILKLKKATSLK